MHLEVEEVLFPDGFVAEAVAIGGEGLHRPASMVGDRRCEVGREGEVWVLEAAASLGERVIGCSVQPRALGETGRAN